jgi:hypothetical protein
MTKRKPHFIRDGSATPVGDYSLFPVLHSFPLKFPAFWLILRMQTNLSARIAVTAPAGGEMSGLMAHFLFAENSPVFMGLFLGFWHKTGQTP